MSKKNNILSSISDLLPEGLDESTLGQIAQLVAKKIEEEVKVQISELTTKVTSFIRGNIEKLKEQAVKELELENETFRNAQLFETVRSMFAVESTSDDELNGINALAAISETQENKIEVLVKEVDKLLKENVQLKKARKVLSGQNEKLQESVVSLKENFKIASGKTQTRHMSDSAIIVSEQNFKLRDKEENKQEQKANVNGNEWLNENIISASKKLIKG
jgi:hypothetical protein